MANSVQCKSCGRPLGEGDRFCPGCGTTVAEPMDTATRVGTVERETNLTQCVSCAAPMGREDRFCPKCGTSRPEEATVVSHVSLRNAQAAHLIEATLGEFEILRQLGTGAMGAVYLARDVALSREVAIKVIAPNLLSDETMISRFRLEAQTVASLRHPNIVNVHAVRQSDDLHYFVMEFIDGPTLRSIVKGHAPLDVDVVQSLVFQVGSALSYAHRTRGGVIHRDVKPANIMVDKEGGAFITDFGISKIAEAQSGLTQTGATIGTPEYMSPEQCRGEPLTGASDQYALGIVAYEMLCGHTPFSGSQYYVMVAHTSEPPKPIREVRPDCSPQVAQAIERMLAKRPGERWPDLDSAVTAMGGTPLGYKSPIRSKIVTLTGATLVDVPAVDTGSSQASGAAAIDTATSVTVSGIPSVIESGDSFTLEADVRGASQDSLGGLGVVWASTDPSIAKVEGGVVHALRPGTVSITAMAGNVANSVLLTVAEPSPAAVLVRPGSVRIQRGGRMALSATVQDRKGRPLERAVSWRSNDAAVATVTQEGQVVAKGDGTVSIVAESEGVAGTAEVIVEASATALSPRGAEKRPAPTRSGPRPRPAAARSASRRPILIAASIIGLLLVGFGVMNFGGAESTTPSSPVSVPAAATQSSPAQGGTGPGAEPPAAATVESAGPEPSDGGGQPPTVTAPPSGTVTSAPPTTAASSGAAPTTQRGTPPPPAPAPAPTPGRVSIALASTAMAVGGTQDASAQVFTAAGGRMTSGFDLGWRSTDADVLSVDPRGAVRAGGPGTAWLVATAGAARDSVLVSVAAVVAAVDIAESDLALEVGGSRSLSAAATDADGTRLQRDIAWRSSDLSVVRVDATTGRLTAAGPGTAQVTASADGFSDAVTVTVAAPAPTLPTSAAVQTAIAAYVDTLAGGDEDAVRRLWGSDDEDGLGELLDLMDERGFSATLGPVGSPSAQGAAATVPFSVDAVYRNFAGAERRSTLDFVGRFERSGSAWNLVSVIVP